MIIKTYLLKEDFSKLLDVIQGKAKEETDEFARFKAREMVATSTVEAERLGRIAEGHLKEANSLRSLEEAILHTSVVLKD